MTKSRHKRDAEKEQAIIKRYEAAQARRKRIEAEEEQRGIERFDREETQRQNALKKARVAEERAQKAEEKRIERENRDNEAEELRGIRETDIRLTREAREEAEIAKKGKKKVRHDAASHSTTIDLDEIASSSQALHKAKKAVSKARTNIRKRARMTEEEGEKEVPEVITRESKRGRIIRPSARLQN